MANVALDVASNNASFKVDSINVTVDPITGTHIPLQISTLIIPKCYHVDVVSNRIDDDKGLAKLIVADEVRNAIIELLHDEAKLAEVFSYACVTKNESVRLGSPVSDYYLISQGVSKIYQNLTVSQRSAVAILIHRAMHKWNLVAVDRKVSVVLHEKTDDITESVFHSEIMLEQAYRVITALKFRTVNTDKTYTNVKVLAGLFCESINEIVPRLENLSRFATALQSTLARVYTFITRRVTENYAPDERSFVEDANFIFLATNLGIVKMALENPMLRPTSNIVYWKEHDAIIYDSLMNNKLFQVVPLVKYKERFAMTRMISSRGKLAGVVVTKLLSNLDKYNTLYAMKINSFVEYAPFVLASEHDSFMNLLMKNFSSLKCHISTAHILEALISDEVSKLVVTIGIDEVSEMDNLAASFSDRLYVNKDTGFILYTKTLEKSRSNLQFSDFLPEFVSTESSTTMILAACQDYAGKETFDSSVGCEPEYKTKYSNSHILVTDGLSQIQTIKLTYDYDAIKGNVKQWSLDTSFNDLLKLDISSKIVTSRLDLLSADIRRMINMSKLFEKEKYKLAGLLIDSEPTKGEKEDLPQDVQDRFSALLSLNNSVDYVVQVRCSLFVDELVNIAESNSYFKAISHNLLSRFVSYVREHPRKFEALKAGNIYSDEILKKYFSYSVIPALMKLSNVFKYDGGEDDYDHLNLLFARRCMLNNL